VWRGGRGGTKTSCMEKRGNKRGRPPGGWTKARLPKKGNWQSGGGGGGKIAPLASRPRHNSGGPKRGTASREEGKMDRPRNVRERPQKLKKSHTNSLLERKRKKKSPSHISGRCRLPGTHRGPSRKKKKKEKAEAPHNHEGRPTCSRREGQPLSLLRRGRGRRIEIVGENVARVRTCGKAGSLQNRPMGWCATWKKGMRSCRGNGQKKKKKPGPQQEGFERVGSLFRKGGQPPFPESASPNVRRGPRVERKKKKAAFCQGVASLSGR